MTWPKVAFTQRQITVVYELKIKFVLLNQPSLARNTPCECGFLPFSKQTPLAATDC